MTPAEVSDRLLDFSVGVGAVVDALPDTKFGRHVAGQLVRCGTSSFPNYEEGCAAERRDDFIHKLSVALKEMRESHAWLRFIARAQLLREVKLASLVDEAAQLMNILGKSVATAKRTAPRKRP
jgi:four helix bundle protein